ncbi:MAG: glycosyltransferase family 2 protein, partial [Phycisphaerales bacterium]
ILMTAPEHDTRPLPLAVAIVCKDNEDTIARTLESVRTLAAHVVALDSGSTDGTIDILRAFGAEVVSVEWAGHIRTKQMALDRCEHPWAMHLDSDESLTPELQASLRAALSDPADDAGAFLVNRMVWWDDKPLRHAWQPEWRLRVVRRGAAAWGGVNPHDALALKRDAAAPNGAPWKKHRLRGALRHDTIDTIHEFLVKQSEYGRISAEALHAMGVRGAKRNLVLSPVAAWCKQMLLKQAWRDGWRGWAAASAAAAAALHKHTVLLEHTHNPPPTSSSKSSSSPSSSSPT